MLCNNRIDAGALTNVAIEVDDTHWPPPTEGRPQRWKSSGVIASKGDDPRHTRLAGSICFSTRNHLEWSSATKYSSTSVHDKGCSTVFAAGFTCSETTWHHRPYALSPAASAQQYYPETSAAHLRNRQFWPNPRKCCALIRPALSASPAARLQTQRGHRREYKADCIPV